MRRSAGEVIRNLEMRVAKLEKSAAPILPESVLEELEDLLSEDPFYENDMDIYWFTIEATRTKKLRYIEEASNYSENFNVYECEVEANITLNDLILDDATLVNPRANLNNFVEQALAQQDFENLRVVKSLGITIKHIGTPTLKTRPRETTRLTVPVKLTLFSY